MIHFFSLCYIALLAGAGLLAGVMLADANNGRSRSVNSIGVPLPPDAAPPPKQVVHLFAEDLPYMEWFRTIYKGAAGKYLIGEPLTRVNRNFELRGSAAERWTVSPDGLTWTFIIRRGLQWSDGQPLTAKDYEFSLKRGADPNNGYDFEWYYHPIKNWADVISRKKPLDALGVKALDDYTLAVTTESPTPYLPLLLTYSWVSPRHAVQKYGDTWSTRPATCISSGPFLLKEWTKGKQMVLVANPMYRGRDKPFLERVVLRLFNSTTPPQTIPAYEAGEIDFTEIGNQAQLARLLSDPILSQQVHAFPNFWTHYLFFNTKRPPFSDRRVRQAFSHAIDRDALCRSALKGFAIPAYAMLPPGFPAYQEDQVRDIQRYDPPLARRLLTEAGYSNGRGFPQVEMWLRNESIMIRDAAEGIQALLKRNLGVDVEVRNLEAKTFMDGLNSHRTLFGLVPYEFDYVDPSNMLGVWMSGGRHDWANRTFDRLLVEANGEVRDPARRTALYQQAERLLIDDVGGVFITHKLVNQVWKPYIKGDALEPDRFGYRAWRGDQVANTMITLYITKAVDTVAQR
ncbi:MAG: peptide ABC transporter substrate-binding protein [Candidatus Latescibacteria bacterium]|nr:peptide ABC transporter substrate-binding protein [Candidatus Latescibacterota bacterium]